MAWKKYNNSITLILIVHDVRWSIDSDSYFHRVTFDSPQASCM